MRVGLDAGEGMNEAILAARVNTAACKPVADHESPDAFGHSHRVVQFAVPLEALRDGYNVAQLFLERGQKQKVIWVELRIAPAER